MGESNSDTVMHIEGFEFLHSPVPIGNEQDLAIGKKRRLRPSE